MACVNPTTKQVLLVSVPRDAYVEIPGITYGEKDKLTHAGMYVPDGGIAFAEWLRKKHLTIGEPVKFKKYGTARMYLKKFPGEEIELVQTRSEKYTDRTSRDPSTAFGSIEDDCFRRDLTINSLYYDISGDRMLDITGKAISDLENHLIRTPSDPEMTFDDEIGRAHV